VNLSKEFGPFATGKTIIIASTEGNVSIPDREEKVGLNVYRKKDCHEAAGRRYSSSLCPSMTMTTFPPSRSS
jgi:hypothetical protein